MKFLLFGSTGDLARHKIIPALLDLHTAGELDDEFQLIAIGRRDYSTAEYVAFLAKAQNNPVTQDTSGLNLEYVQVDFDHKDGFGALWETIDETKDPVFAYLSLGHAVVSLVLDRFEDQNSLEFFAQHQVSISVEKPFGGSLNQAQQFNQRFSRLIDEEHLFINDHILFKKPVMALDLEPNAKSRLLELTYNASQITVVYSEDLLVGERVGFYDGKGVSVDMFQSHLLQLAAIALYECHLEDLKECKAQFIDSLEVLPETITRAQYQAYAELSGVDTSLQTETFLRASFKSDLPEFTQTRFEFVSGKGLEAKFIKLLIAHPDQSEPVEICIEPCSDMPIHLPHSDGRAYHRLLQDLFAGNQDRFVSLKEVEAQWRVAEDLRTAMQNIPLQSYTQGDSWQSISA